MAQAKDKLVTNDGLKMLYDHLKTRIGVSGVKGVTENTYRTGDVSISPDDIGLGSSTNAVRIRNQLGGSLQTLGISYRVDNSLNSTLNGKALSFIIDNDGMMLYNHTDSATIWNVPASLTSTTALQLLNSHTASINQIVKSGDVCTISLWAILNSNVARNAENIAVVPSGYRPTGTRYVGGYSYVTNVGWQYEFFKIMPSGYIETAIGSGTYEQTIRLNGVYII